MKKINVLLLAFLLLSFWANAQQYPFNGLDMNMGNLSRLSNAQSRSISPENFTGERGKGEIRMSGIRRMRPAQRKIWGKAGK